MNVLSLFDGMSCVQIALSRCGIKVDKYFASEIDKFAMKITQKNYPDTIQIGDVLNVKAKNYPDIDLLIGGSPCQGFSFSGKGLNFDDPRSKLFFEFYRLLKECNPKYWLLENVFMNKEHSKAISKLLGINPILINSADFSAQNRKRYYWTNIPYKLFWKKSKAVLEDILQKSVPGKYFISEAGLRRAQRKNYSKPQINPTKTGTLNTVNNSARLCFDKGTTFVIQRGRGNNHGGIKAKNGKTPALTANAWQQNNHLYNGRIRRLTPVECERLQTVDDNYTEGVSDSQRYKMLGNGMTVDVIAYLLKGVTPQQKTEAEK